MLGKFFSSNFHHYLAESKPKCDSKMSNYKVDYSIYGANNSLKKSGPFAYRNTMPRIGTAPQYNRPSDESSGSIHSSAFPGTLNYSSIVDYQLGTNLGQGAYGQVFKVVEKIT